VASEPCRWAFRRQAATEFKSRGLTHFLINFRTSRPDVLALTSERLHAIFTVHSLQFAIQTPVRTGALES
jgi:hypothetical protein